MKKHFYSLDCQPITHLIMNVKKFAILIFYILTLQTNLKPKTYITNY